MIVMDESVFETCYKKLETYLKDSGWYNSGLQSLLEELKGIHDRHVRELDMIVEKLSGTIDSGS